MSGRVATIAVLSQVHAGHVPAYHRRYAEAFAAQGARVLDLPPAPRPWWQRATRQLERWSGVRGRRAWRGAAARVRAAERAAGTRADAVFFVYLDLGFLEPAIAPAAVDRWFPWPWAGVIVGPAAVRQPGRIFPGGERVLEAPRCRAVVVTDDDFVAAGQAAWPGRRVIAMPEMADLRAPAGTPALAELRAFARGRRLVGSPGVISAKKNVAAFLALARHAQEAAPELAFFLAGDFSPAACPGPERRALAAALAARPANVALFPQPLRDGPEFNGWVAACDVVWLAYRDVAYKSNVLTKAAHFRKPSLVSPGHIMGRQAERFRLGATVDADDPVATLAALRRLIAEPAGGRDFAAFVARNDAARLDATAAAVLEAFRA